MSNKKIGQDQTFSENLNIVVEKSPLKKKDIAEKLKIDPSTLSGLLKGKSKPSFDLLLDIAQLFNVSLDWLTGIGEDHKEEDETVYIAKIVEIMHSVDRSTQADIFRSAEREKFFAELRRERNL